MDGGAEAITVHGRTREARYRYPADWDAIAEIAAAVPVPVIGNGDLLYPHEIASRLADVRLRGGDGRARRAHQAVDLRRSDATGTGTSRPTSGWRSTGATSSSAGALARPVPERDDPDAVLDEYGRTRLREFVRWHAGFWCRYAPRRSDGTWPSMQHREAGFVPRSPLEALLSRSDDAALDYVTDELIGGGDLATAPPAGRAEIEDDLVEAG